MCLTRKCCSCWTLIAVALAAGCAGSRRSATVGQPVHLAGVTTAEAVQAAEDVLSRMHFAVEKADSIHGVVRTEPLRAAQVFEFWRQDDSTARDVLEADLQTVRRSVQIQFESTSEGLSVDCRVRVQRLSMPEAPTASVSQAYQMHTRSTPTTQTLELTPNQKGQIAWIDLPDDAILAQRIVQQILDRINHSNRQEGAT